MKFGLVIAKIIVSLVLSIFLQLFFCCQSILRTIFSPLLNFYHSLQCLNQKAYIAKMKVGSSYTVRHLGNEFYFFTVHFDH